MKIKSNQKKEDKNKLISELILIDLVFCNKTDYKAKKDYVIKISNFLSIKIESFLISLCLFLEIVLCGNDVKRN